MAKAKGKPAAKKPKTPRKKAVTAPTSRKPAYSEGDDYAEHREAMAAVSRERSAKGRDIGPLPEVADPERRERCRDSLLEFCRTYFPRRFKLPFAACHFTAISEMESCARDGGQLACAMPRGSGKALALDTPLPTPVGWTTMGEVQVGDRLYDEQGKPCSVTFATEVQHDRECYRVTFDDGEVVTCCADHQWTVTDKWSRQNPLTLTTKEMAGRVVLSEKRGWKECRYTIPIASPLKGKSGKFHIAPYMLGVWLGDGATATNRITIGDADLPDLRRLIERHEAFGSSSHRKPDAGCATYVVGEGRRLASPQRVELDRRILSMTASDASPTEIQIATGVKKGTIFNIRMRRDEKYVGRRMSLRSRLGWLGVLGNKHIPQEYLRASEDDRMELLRGLMDTDGSISQNGSEAEYCTKLPRLRDDVLELLSSLGFKCRSREKRAMGRVYHRIHFSPTDGRRVFNLPRKAARQVTRSMRISANRTIVSIEPVSSVPVRCVQVDSPSHLYLCGRGMIPTHNTAIAECALLHSLLYGFQKFAVLLQATKPLAAKSFKKIKRELETNPLLAEDFPEVCYPISQLERINNRARGQTLDGIPTMIEWTAESVSLPIVAGSVSSGATMVVSGIESASRGLSVLGPDGSVIRPGLILVDDAQTRESAKSPTQTADREAIIADDIMGMVGPGETLSLIKLCTVIFPNDLSDRFLSTEKHPEFRSIRTKMIEVFPERMDLWDEYDEVRRDSLRSGDGGKRANEFIEEKWDEMHRGAVVSWPDRKRKGELSGIQSAMNLYYTNPRGFRAEYQNEPEPDGGIAVGKELVSLQVATRLSGLPRFEVPREASRLTAFVDPGGGKGRGIWYAVVAWTNAFGGSVIDYGCWPRQTRSMFAADDLRPGLAEFYPKLSMSEAVFAGLRDLTNEIFARPYIREVTGEELKIERCLIDVGWEADTIYPFCRQSKHESAILPSKGIGRTLTSKGVSEWKPRPGEPTPGWHWRLTVSEKGKGRMVQFDPDAWKTVIHERLTTPPGGRGYLSLWGKSPGAHEMISEHLAAEYSEPATVRGVTFDKWRVKPHKPDNHLLDCVTGAALAASVLGLKWDAGAAVGEPAKPKPPREKVKLSDVFARKNGRG